MTEKDDHINKLNAQSSTARHQAARYFCENPSQDVLDALFERRQVERVMHVKKAIEAAINKITFQAIPLDIKEDEIDINEDIKRHLHSRAIEEFSSILLHELEPKIGFLRLAAKKEIDDFSNSKVNYHLNVLSGLIKAIACLKRASATPKKKETDIVQLLKDTCAEEVSDVLNYHLEGPEPFLKFCDPDLMKIAVSNGLRNSTEALLSCPDTENKNIVVTWGATEVDCWISILDDGPGLSGSAEAAFKIGTSNKQGHSGFGLAIIKQAMQNMDGHAILCDGRTGGALLSLRWPV